MSNNKNMSIHIRVTEMEHKRLTEKAKESGFATVSSYLRVLGLNSNITVKCKKGLDYEKGGKL